MSRQLHVGVVAEQLRRRVPGGIGRYAAGLLGGLAALEAPPAVTVLASRRTTRTPSAGGDPLERWGFALWTWPVPGPVLTRAWDLGLLAPPGDFDVVHAVSVATPPMRRRATASGRPPALSVTVHDLAWRQYPEATTPRGRHWHEAALRRALRRAEAVVVPSRHVADQVVATGAPAVRLVPVGVDHLPPPEQAATARLLERLGIRGPFLLTASTREPRKNLARLVAAYERARPNLPEPWPLVVVGPPGWGEAATGLLPDTSGPPPGVVWAGPVSDPVLAGLYARAHTFVYVPLTEGYGLPPIEAMAFGLPVVASSTVPSADPGELSASEMAGVVRAAPAGRAPALAVRVDPLSVEAIAQGLVQASTDHELRATLAASGQALAATRTWRVAAEQHVELWRSLR